MVIGANGTQDPLMTSFSTSTDGFRRHGASHHASMAGSQLKMLYGSVVICVVHEEERKSLRRAEENLKSRSSGRDDGAIRR